MKLKFGLLLAAISSLGAIVPANAVTFNVDVNDRPYYVHGPGYYVGRRYYVWVPGHWDRRHRWVHGHYIIR